MRNPGRIDLSATRYEICAKGQAERPESEVAKTFGQRGSRLLAKSATPVLSGHDRPAQGSLILQRKPGTQVSSTQKRRFLEGYDLWSTLPINQLPVAEAEARSRAFNTAIDAPVDASIHWADPKPWVISQDDPMKDVFGDRDQAHVLLADGAVLLLRRSDLDNKKLKAMLTFADGD